MDKEFRYRSRWLKEGRVEIKLLIRSPMETGERRNRQGETVPANFIEQVNCYNSEGEALFRAFWTPFVSRNPYLKFYLDDVSEGDELTIEWLDNLGGRGSQQINIR